MAEDFYGLSGPHDTATQLDDYLQDEPYHMGLSPETAAVFAESMADHHTEVNTKSVQRYTQEESHPNTQPSPFHG